MKIFKVMMLVFGAMFFPLIASAEGLPANPWLNHPNIQALNEDEGQNLSAQVSAAAVDMWSKVRNTEEFRQWSMANQTPSDNTKDATDEKQNILNMLENFNKVGYFLPADYKNIVKQMPTSRKSATSQKTQSSNSYKKYADSYNNFIREWKAKYYKTKNNSLNILDNSYRRTLNTLKRTTGFDINKAINDSVRAFR